MNILAKYTRRALSRNKTRTLVTIIGIVLSMALFTAVIEGAWSGLSFLIRAEVETSGSYMVIVPAETAEKRQRLAADGRIKSYALVWEEDADVEGTDYVPSLATVTEDFPALSGLKLTSGRYPEKAGEVIVPDSWLSDMRDAVSEEYTIVGTYKHFFYTAITFGESYGYAEAWVELKNPAEYESFAKSYGEEFLTHRMLLVLYGAAGSNNLRSFLFGFTAILVGLIMFGSISLIYNSFSISVADRTREFGILKSVGATKKQIRRSVLYEALVLSAAAIPIGLIVGCAGIGITL
ncbi:MAG: ABC transporter permease, partial [Oscillospiraceae bacterium]|nr:ABC transporter permease [Oscillospiraceae bacterium]